MKNDNQPLTNPERKKLRELREAYKKALILEIDLTYLLADMRMAQVRNEDPTDTLKDAMTRLAALLGLEGRR